MAVDITIPTAGESVSQVTLSRWEKSEGDFVEKDEIVAEIETDKVSMEINAPESGVLSRSANEGDELEVGTVIGQIDPDAKRPAGSSNGEAKSSDKSDKKAAAAGNDASGEEEGAEDSGDGPRATSVAKKMASERGVDLANVKGTGSSGRITKQDVLDAADAKPKKSDQKDSKKDEKPAGESKPAEKKAAPAPKPVAGSRDSRREKMSKIRQRIAQRLVEAQHTAAMLTTFNEVDMSEVMRLRSEHKEQFEKKHGIGLGFMSFFIKASCSALQAFPRVNAYIVGDEIEYHDFCDVSVAVGTEKGLVVPVIRNAESMSFAEIEAAIKNLAGKARDNKLTIEDMTGGTFTVSNGGVYGSLNSTPILNPPQSAILGMHTIKKRPIEDPKNPGQIVLRPMMYLAVSYDHRIIDGSEAVSFLVHIKNCLENPERLLLGI